jgi:hypothetical protein
MSLAAVKVAEAEGLSVLFRQIPGHSVVAIVQRGGSRKFEPFRRNQVARAITTRSSRDSEMSLLVSEHNEGRIAG